MFEDTNPRNLSGLLGEIDSGSTVLPEFQRSFVWDSSATKEIIASIAKGFPAGSILRIRNARNLFEYREFEGSPKPNPQPTFLVLDGQQRLTSLYQAFYGKGDFRYFIDIKKLLDGAEFDECVVSARYSSSLAKTYSEFSKQAAALMFPLKQLYGLRESEKGFERWARSVVRSKRSEYGQQEADELEDRLNEEVYEKWISSIVEYQFPVVTLSDETSLEAVCTIFETLNRTGVKLTAYDLLTARFWPNKINLRQEWEEACQEYPQLEEMGIDPYYLLQALSLVRKDPPGCKRSEVLDIRAYEFNEWWPKVVQGYALALDILREDCGVINPKWLPWATILIPMAGVLAKIETSQDIFLPKRKKLIRWYWRSVLSQTYERALNSQVAKDYRELQEWLNGGNEPEAVAAFDSTVNLREITFRQRGLYRTLMGLVLRNRPKDFHSGTLIDSSSNTASRDDHHIFPKAYLAKRRLAIDVTADNILNHTLIDSKTNKKIGKTAPSEYIPKIERDFQGDIGEIFESHLCSVDLLRSDDFEAFIADRERRFQEEIEAVTRA